MPAPEGPRDLSWPGVPTASTGPSFATQRNGRAAQAPPQSGVRGDGRKSPCARVLQEAEGDRDWAGRAQSAPAHCPLSLSEPQSLEHQGVSVAAVSLARKPGVVGLHPERGRWRSTGSGHHAGEDGYSAAGVPTHRGGPARGRGRCHRSARRAGGAGRWGREAWAGKGGRAGVLRARVPPRDPSCRPTARCIPSGPSWLTEKSRAAAGAWWLRVAARVVQMPATRVHSRSLGVS